MKSYEQNVRGKLGRASRRSRKLAEKRRSYANRLATRTGGAR